MSDVISLGSVYLKWTEQNKIRPKPQPGESLEGGMAAYVLAGSYIICVEDSTPHRDWSLHKNYKGLVAFLRVTITLYVFLRGSNHVGHDELALPSSFFILSSAGIAGLNYHRLPFLTHTVIVVDTPDLFCKCVFWWWILCFCNLKGVA